MRKILLALFVSVWALPATAADNYTATAGSGLTFAAKDNGSAVYFPRHIMCDNTTTTQCVAVNASGQITVIGSGTFAAQINGFTSWGGGTLGAMANYGTSPGAVLVPGVNAFITNTNSNGQANGGNIASRHSIEPDGQCSLGSRGYGRRRPGERDLLRF
jgi:hypothetical protein